MTWRATPTICPEAPADSAPALVVEVTRLPWKVVVESTSTWHSPSTHTWVRPPATGADPGAEPPVQIPMVPLSGVVVVERT